MSSFQWGDIDLNAGNTVAGIIRNIDLDTLTADVDGVGTGIPIHYHCETDPTDDGKSFDITYPDELDELGALAFGEEDEVLVMFRRIDNESPVIVGFPNQARECLPTFYIRLTIDTNALFYGGQKISITYYSETEEKEVTTQIRTIHGGGDNYDSEKHGLAGPFLLEGWDRVTDVKINLYRERDIGGITNDPAPPAFEVVDPDHTKWFDGILNMFQYYTVVGAGQEEENDIRVWLYDYVEDNDPPGPFPISANYCDGSGVSSFVTWYKHLKRLGFTTYAGTPFLNVTLGSQFYRRTESVYKTVAASLVPEAADDVERVYNWSTNEYVQASVWSLNINYNLKQMHYYHWLDDAPDYWPGNDPSTRFLGEYYSNAFDVVGHNPEFPLDRIISIPWVTYTPLDRPIFSTFNDYVVPGVHEGTLLNFEDWTPATQLTDEDAILLIVTDESDLNPLPGYTVAGNTHKERYDWSAVGDCPQITDDEMEQLVESVSTLEYWF